MPDPVLAATPLSLPYDPKTVEVAAQAIWEQERCHAFDPSSTAEVFSIDTPPPTVSGSLHVGHVFSYTQAECIARYQRMRGKNVFYPFGFDGNGLPTERLTEAEHGVRGRDMPRPDFVRLCLETSRKYEREFETFMRSLGISADWSLAYSTIDERCVRISQRGFLDLWHKGHAYLKEAPAFWCTQCRHRPGPGRPRVRWTSRPASSTVRFDLAGGGSFEIATTRAELMPACVAVFLHPTHPRAKELVGRRALVPLQDGRDVPILADERVDPAKGTGIVMCCTFGDKTDMEWFKKHDLPLRTAIALDGTMTDLAGPEKGLYVTKARKAFLERLTTAGHVTGGKDIVHPVAVHERCKTDVQFLATKQVYVRLLDKKDELVAQGEKVRWFPEHMGKRYRDWVENLEWDWGISRQRFYGVPFPFWHCKACATVKLARDQDLPVDPTAASPHGPCEACGSTDFVAERDVMDTWATSSETPQINARAGDPDGPPPHAAPDVDAAAGPRDHPHLGLLHDREVVPPPRRGAVARRDDLGLGPGARPREDQQVEGQRPHRAPRADREARGRRAPLLGPLGQARHRLRVHGGGHLRRAAPLREALERVAPRGGPPRGLRPRPRPAPRSARPTAGCACGSRGRSRRRPSCSTPTSSASRRSASRSSSGATSATTGSRWPRTASTTRARRAPQPAGRPRRPPTTRSGPCSGCSPRSCRTSWRRCTRATSAPPSASPR